MALFSAGLATLTVSAQSGGATTLTVDAENAAGLAWLRAAGAELLADYGAYSLWEVPAQSAPRLAAAPQGLRRVQSGVDLRGLTLDGAAAQPEPLLAPGLQAPPPVEGIKRLWLVQFAGPPRDDWLETLRADGQEVAGCYQGALCLVWGKPAASSLNQLGRLVRWTGEFHPAYRLHPDLRPGGKLAAAGTAVEVTVQMLDAPETADALAGLARLAIRLDQPGTLAAGLRNFHASIPVDRLAEAAALAPVVNIAPYRAPRLMDEMQAQIMAGNISNSGVKPQNYTEYLSWLGAQGLPADPAAYPIVDVVDDGVDAGDAANVLHPDFYELGSTANSDRIAYLQSCLFNLSTNGVGGHGNLNAGIVGGYNSGTGWPNAEISGLQSGFRFGLGISPFGRLAATKVFSNNGVWDVRSCGDSYSGMVAMEYAAGARIGNNSWGDPDAMSEYDAGAQEYDALTRDADPAAPGNQEMLHVFSAGNSGGSGTIGSPGTGKNVLTVGATDFPRSSGASAENLAYFSSRGPTDDQRAKPDLVAPGAAIAGPASQDPLYTGWTIYPPKFYPNYPSLPSQTLYAHSFGTSHAAPAVAGAAQLLYADYAAAHGGAAPSPALVKALALNSARYLNGSGTGGNLPSNTMGWGMTDLSNALTREQPLLVDQAVIFGGSGEAHTWDLVLDARLQDLRVTLVWTDAPGSTVGPVLVNDLDLEVTAGGVTYLGNVFSGAYSSQGGYVDEVNNVESVFLPYGAYRSLRIRVTAWNVSGDGVPGNADLTDQDFALVVSTRRGMSLYFPMFTNQSDSQ